jgi:hypothetical protein
MIVWQKAYSQVEPFILKSTNFRTHAFWQKEKNAWDQFIIAFENCSLFNLDLLWLSKIFKRIIDPNFYWIGAMLEKIQFLSVFEPFNFLNSTLCDVS